ncbi:MAG: hypothetical protein H8F28_12360 [Fibrella sp.]|nr:hypothetical protein [Armatimonadota bacterium]
MRILFGPEHDGLHIDPNEPNGYEWWYFDAISDDERYVLVVIFFLGTPMSPYYKAVVDGKNPLPKDWCGVFVSLHEKTARGYVEKGYAYNVYSESDLNRQPNRWAPFGLVIGTSGFNNWAPSSKSKPKHRWQIEVNESGLWFGTIQARLMFESRSPAELSEIEGDEHHNWVCVAPACKVEGSVRLGSGEWVDFSGIGYHDHNFGTLPWSQTRSWLWGRGRLVNKDGVPLHTVFYWNHVAPSTGEVPHNQGAFFLLLDSQGRTVYRTASAWGGNSYAWGERSGRYGLPSMHGIDLESETTRADGVCFSNSLQVPLFDSFLSESPFYERGVSQFKLTVEKDSEETEYTGSGIAEVFEPARLCGPIISRMMWTRIRRRS